MDNPSLHGYTCSSVSSLPTGVWTSCSPVAARQFPAVTFCAWGLPTPTSLSVSRGSPRPQRQSGETFHPICGSPSGWPHSSCPPSPPCRLGQHRLLHPWQSSSKLPQPLTPSRCQPVSQRFEFHPFHHIVLAVGLCKLHV